ncbi:MAG TPA: right-handed parallel beta-helix repeat-containing protein, partial [Planctomycetota bacterium]|nr:right-handed parallel beta-helix repeat-containing protein [Planctomycetota bacterium]
KAYVRINDNVTLSIDGAMLVQGDTAPNWFILNNNDGASGIENADDADADSYDTMGIDADAVAVTHPWVMIPAGESMWDHLKQIAEAAGVMYMGMDECGCLRFRAKLKTGYADPSSLATITSVQEVESAIDEEQANKIIGHGVRIKEFASDQTVWTASASNVFDNANGSGTLMNHAVADSGYFPNTTDFPEYWAQYEGGEEVSTWISRMLPAFGMSLQDKWLRNEKDAEVVGLKDPILHWKTWPGGNENSGDDAANVSLDVVIFDAITRADSARILLLNDSGDSLLVFDCYIRGKPVIRYSGDRGYIHDSFIDYDDIRRNGERVYEFGNNYICSAAQLQQLADWAWKRNRTRRHLYTVSLAGRRFDFTPGEWYTLQVGGAGEREYIDAVCECYEVQVECSAGELGRTVLTLREVYQNWTYNSGAVARYLASGDPRHVPNFNLAKIAAATYGGMADFYCDGTADQTEIAAAIASASAAGILSLTDGTFITAAAIKPLGGLVIDGAGAATIIEKNCNDYALDIQGAAEAYLENITIRDLVLTRNASDTNVIALLHIQYARHVILENVELNDSYGDAGIIENCEDIKLVKCRVNGAEVNGVILKQTVQAALLSCLIASCGGIGCEMVVNDTVEMMDRGDCETDTAAPIMTGESSNYAVNASYVRTDEIAPHGGSYCGKITVDDPSTAFYFMDGGATSDMHGMTAGNTYLWTFWAYRPAGNFELMYADVYYYYSAAWHSAFSKGENRFPLLVPITDEWYRVSLVLEIPIGTTGVQIKFADFGGGGTAEDYLYIDDMDHKEGVGIVQNGYILDGCTIKDCGGDGVYVATNEARITNNIIEENTGKGLRIAAGTRNYVFNNASQDNGADEGIDNTNEDNFYDAGIDTQVGLNSWQGVGV